MQTQQGTLGTSTSSDEGKKHDKLPTGPNIISNSEGKRKASVAWAFTDGPTGGKARLSSSKVPSPKELSIHDSPTKVVVNQNGLTSIKGKKVLAQGRTNPNLTKSTVLQEGKKSGDKVMLAWSPKANLHPINGSFTFSNKRRVEMAKLPERKGGGNTFSSDRGDTSKPHPFNGLVRHPASRNMEMIIPFNSSALGVGVPTTLEPILGFDAKPMVELLDRNKVESNSETNGRGSTYSNLFHGESVCSEATPSVSTNLCIQHPCESSEDEHGSTRAL